jgi:hypothetical protein
MFQYDAFLEEILKKKLLFLNKKDIALYKEEFEEFLPEKIFDFHIHTWKKDFIKDTISLERIKQNPLLDQDIGDFPIEDFDLITKKLFPANKYYGLFFGLPLKEVDLEENNDYVREVCRKKNTYGLYVPDPDLKEIPLDFFKNRFIGFKPYLDLLPADPQQKSSSPDISVFDFVSKKVLEYSDRYGLILLLHIPRKGRLGDKKNIEEITTISQEYPNIKLILAHAGRSYCYKDIENNIDHIVGLDNLYIDTAMINDNSVIRLLLEKIGPERVIYGSDLPVSAIRGINMDIDNKHYFITDTKKSWSMINKELAPKDLTFFIYETLRAIKSAARDLSLNRKEVESIFFLNAIKLIDGIKGSDIKTDPDNIFISGK